jgi:hypothetical protein
MKSSIGLNVTVGPELRDCRCTGGLRVAGRTAVRGDSAVQHLSENARSRAQVKVARLSA